MDEQCKQFSLERLTQFVAELFGVQQVAADADLMDLGLASLSAIQLTVLIKEQCGVELPLASMFDCTTLTALALEVQGRLDASLQSSVAAG